MSRFVPTLGAGVSRRDIALSPAVWLIVGLTFGCYAIACLVIPYVFPHLDRTHLQLVAAFLGISSVVLLRLRPPEPDAPMTHAVLVLVYVAPTLAICAFAPDGSLPLGAAMFIGPLTAVWIIDRRQIVAHLAAAALTLFIPVALGIVDAATIAGLIWMVPSIWAIAACCVLVLEAAEQQGDQLAALVKRDPLTGLGNRRLLDEQLDIELTRHRVGGRPLTILALDLNGFKALNDTVGHAAGDELLKATADQLLTCARKHDIVVRQGGDEFCLVLPETSPEQAEVVAGMIRARLGDLQSFGQAISTGVGMASYPEDGDEPGDLLDAADAQLRADKALHPARGTAMPAYDGESGDAKRVPGGIDTPADPLGDLDRPVGLLDGLTRREMAVNRALWRATAGMYFVYPILGLIMFWSAPQLRTAAFLPVCLGGLALGVWYLLSKPPAMTSLRNHVVVVTTYLFPVLALAATKPAGAATIALAMWIGPVAAVRLQSRWQVAAHWVAATLLLSGLVVTGLVKPETTVALLMLIGTFWVLGICCIVVLEAAEAQGDELARLVRRDPLTGAGNRRQLQERLTTELALHRLAGAQLSVLALDLNGFKALNDTVGHAAGDELLRTVARELTTIVDGRGDVVRQGGDEFAVLLPWCTALEAEGVMAAVRTRLGEIVVAGVPVSTGVGAATFPIDAVELEGLLDRADNRLRADKYGSDAAAEPRAKRVDAGHDGRTMSAGLDEDWFTANFGPLT